MTTFLVTNHLQLGDQAPDFEQESTVGRIRFYDWAKSNWVILFSHPEDFTPVCTTELGAMARLKSEFDKRGAKIIGLSVDPVVDHKRWIRDIEETQSCVISYPLIADSDQSVSHLYGMIHPNASDNFTVRSVFVIDPNKKIRLMIAYPASTGRDFNEILRVVDSLQMSDRHKVVTPANWRSGELVIISPSVTNEAELRRLFPAGFSVIKPYLRYTQEPK